MDLFVNSIKNRNIEEAIQIYNNQFDINISAYNHYLLKTAFVCCDLDNIKYIINQDRNIDLSMYNYKLLRNIVKQVNNKKYINKNSDHYKTLEYILSNLKEKLSFENKIIDKLFKEYIKNGQIKVVKLILKYINPNLPYNLLKYAVIYNKLTIAKFIYHIYPNIDLTNEKYYILRKTIRSNSKKMAIWLYSLNPKIYLINKENIFENYIIKKTPAFALTKIATSGQLDLLKLLLKNYPDLDVHHEEDTAFSLACEYNHFELAKWLYSNYPMIDVSADDEYAFTWALCLKNVEIYEWLLSIKPDLKPEVKNNWLFNYLCMNDLNDEINWLFEKFPYLLNNYSDILFVKACRYGKLEIAKRLYNKNILIDDSFIIAVNFGQFEIIKWFYELDPLIINEENISNLFKSCLLHNDYEMNEWLLQLNIKYIDIFKLNLKNYFLKICKKGSVIYLKWLMNLNNNTHFDIFIGFYNAALNGNIKVMNYLYENKMNHYNGVYLYDSVFENVCNNYLNQPTYHVVLTEKNLNNLKYQLYDIIEWFIDLIPARYYIKFKNNKLIDWNIFHIQPVYTHNNIEDCPICLNRNTKIKTNCNHYFCYYCINKWTITNDKCPICRQHILHYTKLIE